MKGRDKCELLNEIRQKIADENNIKFTIYDCTFEGDCTGTCPKCESELKYLEAELAKKQARGEKINLNGIFKLEESDDITTYCPYPDDEPLAGDIVEIQPLAGLPAEPFIEPQELGNILPQERLQGNIHNKDDLDEDY